MISESKPGPTVFAETIRGYLRAIAAAEPHWGEERLGGIRQGHGWAIPFLGDLYQLSDDAVTDSKGQQPAHAVSVILCKYLLGRSVPPPLTGELVCYRDFRDASPYAAAFAANVEGPLARRFGGHLADLRRVCHGFGAQEAAIGGSYDFAARFAVLPKLTLTLIFHDQDEEFPARCTLLFERRAIAYLDVESLALIGHCLAERLNRTKEA